MKPPPWSILLAGLGCVACGGGSIEPAVVDEPAPETPTPVRPASAETDPVADDESEAADDAEGAQQADAEQEPAPKQREVLYKQTQGGLVVDVDGLRLTPKAEPVKKPNGTYGIKITVEAESIDDDTHSLLSPENGPMSFFVKIFDKNGVEQARYGDQRVGDEQQFVMPGGPLTLTREWPSGSVKGPLWWGQSVMLEVGLWGLGRGAEKTRPMQKFFRVNMVAGAKPQAIVMPPEIN